MQTPLSVTFHNMDRSDAVEARVREKVEKLEAFYDRITSCRVIVEAPHRRHHKGKQYKVEVVLEVPGGEIAVTRSPGDNFAHEDVYVAIRDSFGAAQRQLQDYARRQRGDVKTHEPPSQD